MLCPDALVNLLKNTSVIFNPNALFELASRGMPSFAETMTDAKLVRSSAPPSFLTSL